MPGLTLRKLADKSHGPRFDERTGAQKPWPLLGVMIEGEPPPRIELSTNVVDRGVEEGWITRVNERVVTAPGGPPRNPNAKVHVFRQCDEIVLHVINRDGLTPVRMEVRYKVLRNPAKLPCAPGQQRSLMRLPDKHKPRNTKTAKAAFDVIWTYDLELIGKRPAQLATV